MTYGKSVHLYGGSRAVGSRAAMDLRRLRVGEWIAALAGVVLVVALWLPWWSGLDQLDAWSVLSVLDVLLFALGLAAVGLLVVTAIARTPGPGLIADALVAPAAAILAVACLLRVLDMPGALQSPEGMRLPAGVDLLGATTEYGGWVAFAACLAVVAGAVVAMRDERLSRPGRPTDQTGVPLGGPLEVETLPGPPPA